MIRRGLEWYFRRLGALGTLASWSCASSRAPTKEARGYADQRVHLALEQLGLEEDGAESPAELPEANLTSEEEERAQEEFRREYGERR